MRILKIENNKGYFYSFKNKQYEEINNIDRDSLLLIVENILKSETKYEKDDFNDELILNKAQKIVYKDIDNKITELLDKRNAIIDEIDSKYNKACEKYCSQMNDGDPNQQNEDE